MNNSDLTNLIANIRHMSNEIRTVNDRPTSVIYNPADLAKIGLNKIDLINLINETLKNRKTNKMRDTLINTYLDYINNYLTIAKFAEHNGITELQGAALIALAKSVFESVHPES